MTQRYARHPDGKRLRERDPEAARELGRLVNAGPATVEDLLMLGIRSLADLAGRDPDEMYREVCRIDGMQHSLHVRDVYASLVDQARGKPARSWFEYTRERKHPLIYGRGRDG